MRSCKIPPQASLPAGRLDQLDVAPENHHRLELGGRVMQDHGRVPYRPLQLHEHAGAQAESLECISARIGSVPWMRRSEVSALRWADVAAEADGDGVLVTVRRSKTNQEGETTDVRFVKGGVARALRTLRAAASPAPEDRVVPLSPKMVGLRFQAAARAAGVERVTAHLGAGRAGVGAHEPGRVNDRRDARRELEDEPDGGALLGRRDRRTRGRGAVPLSSPGIPFMGPRFPGLFVVSVYAVVPFQGARPAAQRPAWARAAGHEHPETA